METQQTTYAFSKEGFLQMMEDAFTNAGFTPEEYAIIKKAEELTFIRVYCTDYQAIVTTFRRWVSRLATRMPICTACVRGQFAATSDVNRFYAILGDTFIPLLLQYNAWRQP